VSSKIISQIDFDALNKRIEVINLMARAYEFMKHHCLKTIKKDQITAAESRELKSQLNDIQLQIDTLCANYKELSAIACFFRAKLSAMNDSEIIDAVETLILTIQEAGSCYLAVKDLLEQTVMSYNKPTARQSA
jgi:predicted P-loop ATPase